MDLSAELRVRLHNTVGCGVTESCRTGSNTGTLVLPLWLMQTVQWAIISGHPFVYNFHCKQQNCVKFQLVYQDMLHHTQQKIESQYWLKQCMSSSNLSGMSYAIWLTTRLTRNSEMLKKQLSTWCDWKVCLAFHHLVRDKFWMIFM